ncbi:hypothetical protein QE152_g6388 [Popillia japonica]|uniref:Uncharacterized protein n=1 Tax=Popillia japonica TaxID=7064 RepID=A0AAW1MI89_POPJA
MVAEHLFPKHGPVTFVVGYPPNPHISKATVKMVAEHLFPKHGPVTFVVERKEFRNKLTTEELRKLVQSLRATKFQYPTGSHQAFVADQSRLSTGGKRKLSKNSDAS